MKNICKLLLLPLAAMMWSCSDNVIDDLSGKYDENIYRYNYETAAVKPTDKLKKGLKYLNMEFDTNDGHTFNVKVVSREWTLQPGLYKPWSGPLDGDPVVNEFYAFASDGEQAHGRITEGDLEVNMVGKDYDISGILTGGDGRRYVVNYRGPLEFVIGVDDPEPSGYTVTMKVDPVTVTDYNTWQTTVIPGISKYSLSIADPNGVSVAFFEAINTEGYAMKDLMRTYKIQGSPAEPGLIDNGWLVPEYGMAGGAYVVENGEKRYITEGNIDFGSVMGITGETLYNFSGSDLSYITTTGGSGKFSFNIRFVTALEKSGTEMLDLSMQSTTLGREVKYSVLLPEGYDPAAKYPILYMLHGAQSNQSDWFNLGGLAYHTGSAENKMILVSAQASFDGKESFYVDNYQANGLDYEKFYIEEFMPFIEKTYGFNGTRGIAGLSMGGFGTLYYGIKYSDKFTGMYACSPALSDGQSVNIGDMLQTPGIKPFVVEIGTEDFLYDSVKWLKDVAPYLPMMNYIERPGAHDWPFWSACSPKIIKFFDARFK